MAEFNAQHWQKNNVGASHHHLLSFMAMASSNNTQTNAAATLDNKFGDEDAHHHRFPLSLPDRSFFTLQHHYHPQALASIPVVETPSSVAAAGGVIPSSSSLSANEKAGTLIRRSRKKASDKDEEVVHVRARKGQATDSHSAAERVRREKINKKLRCLQELVPGCHRSMGMAVMLEEIINYVYSLQNQVEFLSMELAAAAAATSSSNMETQPFRSMSRASASLQGKNSGGREDYGDASSSTYFHPTATTNTTWSI